MGISRNNGACDRDMLPSNSIPLPLTAMPLLSDRDIQTRLSELPDWTLAGRQIECMRRFRDFIEAIAFVNRLVEPAEAAGHHPDITISYNRVTIALTTHDAGGLTEKDFQLAKTIGQIS